MSSSQSDSVASAIAAYSAIVGIIMLLLIVVSVVIYWKIFSKAGYSGAMSLLMFVPIANIVALCILAFGEWPVLRELEMLRYQVRNQPGPQYPQNPSGPQYPQNPRY
ncbi:hypothetical protein KDW_23240 [Dictyobacter vulcani]|uniref:Uncharacterized protein n=1 Tax=Dictyobacter vulcani TaxID=2607529 RepID=A0A5J4KM09_9CHLR|nr:hypothetical protein [Dictyobacter vulcani]GER88162.1 hypothetical protein KDW_23240 [Dictyobacter vulcani]